MIRLYHYFIPKFLNYDSKILPNNRTNALIDHDSSLLKTHDEGITHVSLTNVPF
jgi:hypothetical protein